ncbi:MAG: iron-sulfur cluster assembly scaffold protein [Rhodobacteraceae bacterium]|nr:MAG: iron-sulfur cluster assembly scaffold protein [Paracoccaceae bacterium]
MENPKDSFELYSDQILLLAGNIPLMDRLESPDFTITRRSKLCGSLVTIDLTMANEVITSYGHEVKACVLGQASAAILAKDVIGKTGREIITVRNAVVTMLNGSKYHPDIFADYRFLSPARQFKNRHDSILLSLNATVDAINNIFKGVNS